MPAYPGLTMLVYTFDPDSTTAEAMQLLANWSTPAPPAVIVGDDAGS